MSPEPIADGGTTSTTDHDLPAPGDRVRDRDGDDGDRLLVVDRHPDKRADDYEIDAIDATVAGVNDTYDEAAPVVDAVYVDDVEKTLDGWRGPEDLRDAVTFGALRAYSFPADRLAEDEGGGRR